MTAIVRCPRVGALVMAPSAAAILVGAAVVKRPPSLTSLGLAEGRMCFVTISITILLVVAVEFLIAVVTFAVLGT
jgi:hypothetical protein